MNPYTSMSHILKQSQLIKQAQIVPEQWLTEQVDIYEDAIPYIKCQIQSTIQHEAAHRKDEEERDQGIVHEKQTIPFPGYPSTDLAHAANEQGHVRESQVAPWQQFSSEGRVEPIAERAEENCDHLLPPQMSDRIISMSLNALFEEAKTAANIDPNYKKDVRAGHLSPNAQGMYMMVDKANRTLEDLVQLKDSSGVVHEDMNDNLWIDVRKIAAPFIVRSEQRQNMPPTYQGPGDGAIEPDVPGVSQRPPVPTVAPISGVPGIPGRESR